MSVWQIWVIAGAILCLMELLGAGLFLLSLGIACEITALFSLFLGLYGQITVFIIASLVVFFSARQLLYSKKTPVENNFGVDALIGKLGVAEAEITPYAGYVKIGGESWPARSDSDEVMPPGTNVIVIKWDGNKAIVSKKS